MKYLHTMVRVIDLISRCVLLRLLGLREIRRYDNEQGRFTLVSLAPPAMTPRRSNSPTTGIRSTTARSHFGHLAFEVDDIYATCRPPEESTA